MKLRSIAGRAFRGARAVVRRLKAPASNGSQPPRPTDVTAETVDLASPWLVGDPFAVYEQLRPRGSVQFLPKHGGWIVLGYDDVQSAFARPEIFSNRPYEEVDAILLGADPPSHTAVRRAVSHQFSRKAIAGLCTFAEEHAAALLKPEMDAVSDYAVPLSEAVAARLLGLDDAALSEIREVRARRTDIADLIRTLDTLAERSSAYAQLTAAGLGDGDARSVVRLLWLAATTTTERGIGRCVLRLLQHPDARRRLEGDLSLVPQFVEEVLRLHPPEQIVPRLTTTPVTLGGATILAGSMVYLCVGAANRDPARFDAPAELRIDRSEVRHFTFGHGIHHCLGATLGRGELVAAVRTLLTGAPQFRSAGALDAVRFWSTMTANAVEALPLKCGAIRR